MTLKWIFLTVFILLIRKAQGDDWGTLKCINGNWVPDAKLIGTGLSCPLPLDGASKSKGKTTVCILKKIKAYDGKTVKTDKIAPELCSIFTQDNLNKQCKKTVKGCVKKDSFKDPKTDTEYKSWYQPYECLEKWTKKACTK